MRALPQWIAVGIAAGLTHLAPAALADDAAMLAKAENAHRQAVDGLGRDRLRRNEERASLTGKMQAAYAKLSEARRVTEKLAAEHDRALAGLDAAKRDAKSQDRAATSLAEMVRQTAQLPRNADDSAVDSFRAATIEGLDARLARLKRAMQFRVEATTVIDRTGRTVEAKLIHVGAVRTLAAGPDANSTGLARVAKHGKWLVDGPMLLPEQIAAVHAAAAGTGALIPFDIDGTLVQHTTTEAERAGWLEAGGAFVWPIVVVGLLGLLLLGERIWYLAGRRVRGSAIGRVKRALTSGDLPGARAVVEPARTDLDRVLLAGIETVGDAGSTRESALEAALLAEEPRLERSLTLLAAAAGVAPLLGLLGTVTGMIDTFAIITQHGTGNPRLLSGGISVALITTQLGLLVAVPLLLGHAWASRAVERRQALLEEGRTVILGVVPKTEDSETA